ncbi:MAG: 30S ribosomal protein S9 [Alphaproteobacteria bacterium]|jgi:small subunit ribosomal protein S9|nr:30S ribosomal protein S9 [Alphaproteobacteria bacterium]
MATKKSLSDLKEAVAEQAGASTGQIAPQERVQTLDKKGRAYGTGRRKDAVARVWVQRGSGKITVNERDIAVYFARGTQRLVINQPFEVSSRIGQFDVTVIVSGGGLTGQAGAVRHGISRALVHFEPGLHLPLKKAGFLTRDSRVVERKKYGRHKARKGTQWVKR